MLLFWHRMREEARDLRSWSLILGLTALAAMILLLIVGNLRESIAFFKDAIARIPALMKIFGGELAFIDPVTLAATLIMNVVAPLLLLVYTILAVLEIYLSEASHGNLEFLFSLPMERFRIVWGRILAYLANLALLHIVLFAAVWTGLALGGERLDPAPLALTLLNLYALLACLGGLSFLLSLAFSDYTRGMLVIIALQFGLFFLNALWGKGGIIEAVNPHHFYDAGLTLSGRSAPWTGLAVLAIGAVVFWYGGIRFYTRKQIGG